MTPVACDTALEQLDELPLLQRNRRMRRVLQLCLLISVSSCIVLLVAALFLAPAESWDQKWLLYAAQQVLAGVQLYGPRLIETNPPLIVWFSMIPVALGRLLHVDPFLMLRLIVLLMITGSVAWMGQLLRRLRPEMSLMVRALLMGLAAVIELWIDPNDFGQREHLVVILLLPYVIAAATENSRRLRTMESIALGVAAGLAICLKPQQALVIVFLEVVLALCSRSLRCAARTEFLTLVLTACGYLLLIHIASPLYLEQIVPILFKTYWAFGEHSALWLALHDHRQLEMLLAAVFFVSLGWRRLRISPAPLMLAVCSYGALLAFLMQHTGWPYQRYPSFAFLCLATMWLLVEVAQAYTSSADDREVPVAALAVVGVIALVAPTAFFVHELRPYRSAATPKEIVLQTELSRLPPKTTVYVFSTSVTAFSEVFQHHLIWGNRFAHLWMMPAMAQNQLGRRDASAPFETLSPGTIAELAATQRKETAEDLAFWKPQLIIVQHCSVQDECQGIEQRNFDMLAWFQVSSAFRAEWSHYRLQRSSEASNVYTRINDPLQVQSALAP